MDDTPKYVKNIKSFIICEMYKKYASNVLKHIVI